MVSKLAEVVEEFDATFMTETVCSAAAWALGEIGGENAVEILKKKLTDITLGRALGSAVIEGIGKSGGKDEYKIIVDLVIDKDPDAESRRAVNKIFSLGESRFLRAALRALMIMKGFDPTGYDSYAKVPVKSYLEAEILPVEKRQEAVKKHNQYMLSGNELVEEFKILAEQYYSSSLNLSSFGKELSSRKKGELAVSALEKAKKTVMSMYGFSISDAEAVLEKYRKSVK